MNVLFTRTPPRGKNKGGKVLLLMTTHSSEALKVLNFQTTYDAKMTMSLLTKADQLRFLNSMHVFQGPVQTIEVVARMPALISVQKLLFLVDTARGELADVDDFPEASRNLAAPYVPSERSQ